jgi:hypothetical protein
MGEITVNFADVQSRAAVPAGDYPGVITDCVLRQKPGKEHPYLNWDVAIAEGEHEGRHSYLVTSFQPDALWKMMQVFQNLGFQAEEVNIKFDDATGQVTEPEVIGLACMIKTYNEPYQNRQTNKISDILGPNGEDFSQQEAEPEPAAAAAAPATRPATKASPSPAAAKNGPAPAAGARRSPFPTAGKPGARTFK